MVEDLRRYTTALNNDGWQEGAKRIMDLANSLKKEGKLPDKVTGVTIRVGKSLVPPVTEGKPQVLTPQLAKRIRPVTGNVADEFQIVNFLHPKTHTIRMMERYRLGNHSEIALPPGWKEILESLSKRERVALSTALGNFCLAGIDDKELYTAGIIRGAIIDVLASKSCVGKKTAQFLKAAFEPY